MRYTGELTLHGSVRQRFSGEQCRREPSVSLLEMKQAGLWLGPISRAVLEEIAATSSFQRICARAETDEKVALRVTTRTVWLERGEVPERPGWHIDRVGGFELRDGEEYCDYSRVFEFPSFILVSFLSPRLPSDANLLGETSTEFVVTPLKGDCRESWSPMSRMYRDVQSALSKAEGARTLRAGDAGIVAYSERTVHRAGIARVAGWRFLLRVGLFSITGCRSPFEDHFVLWNGLWNEKLQSAYLRRVGAKTTRSECEQRSLSLRNGQGVADAGAYAKEWGLEVGSDGATERINALVERAAGLGREQIRCD